jgi:pimeloyl-ACP methyl ester carboxylesterase
MQNDIIDYEVGGIHVARRMPAAGSTARKTPVVLVHGGLHGSWCWEDFTEYLSARGWDCHALNWRGRGKSRPLPPEEALRRSIEDVVADIEPVASQFAEPPLFVSHSMGALATMKYVENHRHAGAALLTPGLPVETEPATIEMPIDFTQMWRPPFELAKDLFFQGIDEGLAQQYYELLAAESPVAASQLSTDWNVTIDPVKISGPLLVLGAEHDLLSDPACVYRLARMLGADYHYAADFGHGVTLHPRWAEIAEITHRWLCKNTGEGATGPRP